MKLIFSLLFAFASLFVSAQSTTVVISQVYGGGGSASGTYNADYVELHNISGADQDITGYKLFYGSAAGLLASTSSNAYTFPATIIPAGGYLLIAAAPGAGLANLPIATDQTFTFNMSGTNGKVAFGTSAMVANTTLALQPAGSVIDFVGYGTASEFETAACPTLSSTVAAIRNNNGCDDTDNNSADFTVAAPNPHNSVSAAFSCTSSPLLIAAPAVPNIVTTFGVASANQTFSVSGVNLTSFPGNVIVNAPAGFEISLAAGSGFTSIINLPISSATLAATTIYIRIQAVTALGSVSGNVSLSGGGASTVNLAVTGNVLSAEPSAQASNIVFSNVADNTLDINWTNGNGASRIVVIHLTSVAGVIPNDGITYTANTNIFSASTTGSGNYVIYNGTGTGPVSVTNLTAGTNYTVNVYEYNSAVDGSENYLTSTNTNNPNSVSTTGVSPLLQKINFTSVSTPQYMGSGTANRIPTMFIATVSNLSPNTTYRYYTQASLPSDLGTTAGGAGNSILIDNTISPVALTYSSSLSITTTSGYGKFTTNANGNFTGSFGFIHTSNTRFNAGNFVTPTVTLTQEGNAFVQYRFALNDSIKVLQFAGTSGANDGSFINGTSLALPGNLIGLWSSQTGGFVNNQVSERPLSMTIAENPIVATGNGGAAWRTSFIAGYDSAVGSWNTIIPNINNDGVRLIQQIDLVTGQVIGCNSDDNGVWPTGTNTVNPVNGSTLPLQIVSADAPLNGGSCYRILPVKINLFEVLKSNDKVIINWQTAQEINMYQFIVEKSTDGIHWKTLSSVNAFGNSNTERRYSAIDNLPSIGTNYYRLKSVSISGAFDYTQIKFVTFKEAIRLSIAPNPASTFTVVNLDSKYIGKKSIQFVDAKGVVVKMVSTLSNSININSADLQKGIYVVKVVVNGEVLTSRLVIQ
jgi:hypothetical protein